MAMCAGKLSTLVGEGQFHGGGDAVGAAEHGLSCLVEVAACNKDDEEESPTHCQLLLFSNQAKQVGWQVSSERFFMSSPPEKSGRTNILLRLPQPAGSTVS